MEPGLPPITSESVYAEAPVGGGEPRSNTIAGGVKLAVRFCDAPVIVNSFTEHEVVDAGHALKTHVLPAGVMLVLLGTSAPEKEPVASSDPEIICETLKFAPLNLYCALGFE